MTGAARCLISTRCCLSDSPEAVVRTAGKKTVGQRWVIAIKQQLTNRGEVIQPVYGHDGCV
jgi:hypothetical protein